MKFVTSDNVTLNYTDTGEKNKRAVLCVPGLGSRSAFWHDFIQLLRPVYRVVLIDPRNQGKSERTDKGERISRHGSDIEELLRELELTDVIGIGNSMGAATLWSYLSLYSKGRLAAMIDLDQSPVMIAGRGWHYGFKDLSWMNYPDYLRRAFGKPTYTNMDDDMFYQAKLENERYPYDPDQNYKCLVDHAEQDWRDVLKYAPVPMLVIAGKQSPYFNYHFTDAIKKINPEIKTEVIDNCGHLVQAERPNKTHELIMKFLHEEKLV